MSQFGGVKTKALIAGAVMKRKMSNAVDRLRSDNMLMGWTVASFITFVLPLAMFSISRSVNMNDENENDNDAENYDEYGNYIGRKHWWQFWKSRKDEDGDGEADKNNGPWWYFWEDDRRNGEEDTGTLVFVYLWTLVMFFALAFFVTKMIKKGNIEALRSIVFGFANYAFICCVLIGGLDGVRGDGKEVEETGWWGQTGALVFFTCFLALLQSLGFAAWISFRMRQAKNESDKSEPFLKDDEKTYGENDSHDNEDNTKGSGAAAV